MLLLMYAELFQKHISGTLSECQTIWLQNRADVLSFLTWVQTSHVYKGFQPTTQDVAITEHRFENEKLPYKNLAKAKMKEKVLTQTQNYQLDESGGWSFPKKKSQTFKTCSLSKLLQTRCCRPFLSDCSVASDRVYTV